MRDYLDELMEERAATDPAYATAKARYDVIKRLVELRKELGLTQQQVADRMGTQRSRIGEIEADNHAVSFDRVAAYAEALGAKLELVLPGRSRVHLVREKSPS
jgi:transcriptional regulator with XRE-family HTH domain